MYIYVQYILYNKVSIIYYNGRGGVPINSPQIKFSLLQSFSPSHKQIILKAISH